MMNWVAFRFRLVIINNCVVEDVVSIKMTLDR